MKGAGMSRSSSPPTVLLRSEQSDGHISLTESTMPAGAKGPPLHTHAFDEAFFVLEGQLTIQLGDELTARGECTPRRPPIRPIESDILHHGPPSRWDSSPESVSGEEALLHDIP
jgi:hypothetical protein